MLQHIILSILIFLFSGSALVFGQAVIKPTVVGGDVVTVADKKFVIASKTGPIDIIITDKSVFKRVSASSPDLTTATPGAITDISVGDTLTVSGLLAPDGKSMPASKVFFLTKSDIAAKNAKESAEWQRRGISGKVALVNSKTNQITVETRTLNGSWKSGVTAKESDKLKS